jgi:hypothetical protein
MARILQQQEGRYARIELDSGEKIVLSIAQVGIAIYEPGFLNILRKRTIKEWMPSQVREFVAKFSGHNPNLSPFGYTVEQLSSFSSIAELEEYLSLYI